MRRPTERVKEDTYRMRRSQPESRSGTQPVHRPGGGNRLSVSPEQEAGCMAGMWWCGEAEGVGEALKSGWLLKCAVHRCLLNISMALGRAWFVPGSVLSPARPDSLCPCPRGAATCWDVSCILWGCGLCAATFQEQFSEQVADDFHASFSPTWHSAPFSWHGPWLGV